MKKTLLKSVMAVLVALFSLNAIAYDVQVSGIYYNLDVNNKIASVSSGERKYTGEIIIPSSFSHNGTDYTVKSIGSYAFYGCSALTSLSIPNGVTSIGPSAFYGCSALTSVTIPNGVTSIGSSAFSGCSGLTSLTIPNSVTSIGANVFWGCNKLETPIYNTFCFAFMPTTYKGGYAIPEGIEQIYDCAFSGCSGLTSVAIPNSVTSIGYSAFSDCSGLASVTIPNNLTTIESSTFSGCSGLTSVTIPNSVTTIGDYAFNGCSSLTSLTIPNSVTSIGGSAFASCSGLTSVTISNSVTSIGNSSFYGCSSLTSLSIPNSVTCIGSDAFSGCSCLTSILIPNSVTSIDNRAFLNCGGLTTITIADGVTFIGSSAFYNCSELKSVISNIEEPFTFGNLAFYNLSPNCVLTVPKGTKDVYIAKGWTEEVFMGGIVEADNLTSNNYLSIEDAEVCKGRSLVLPMYMSNTESITALQFEISLPAGVTPSKCQLTDRKGEDHTTSYKKLVNGNYQVTVFSASKAVFSGTDGAVLNLMLDVDEDIDEGDYPISLTNIELTTVATKAINPADVSATLTVSDVKIGDTDGNGRVSITDAVAVVSHILGEDIDGFVAAAADVDGNGRITITDAVAIVDMILDGTASANERVDVEDDILDPQ